MNTISHRSVWFHAALLLMTLALLGGCGRGPRDLALVDSPAEETTEEVDEAERKRLVEMQLVHILDEDGNDVSMPADLLASAIISPSNSIACKFVCPGRPVATVPGGSAQDWCIEATCNVRYALCRARTLQGAAMLRAEPLSLEQAYVYDGSGDRESASNYALVTGTFSLPPQSVSVRAALLRKALSNAKEELGKIASTFGPTIGLSRWAGACRSGSLSDPLEWATETSTDSTAGLAAETLADAYRFVEELTDDLSEALVAAADAQRSRSLKLEEGVARSVAGSELSRAEAAHQLIGGSPGLLGNTARAFCSSPELTGRARTALGIIRRAAPSPATVKDSLIDTDKFLNGSLTSFPSGSIAVRTAYLDGRCTTVSNVVQCPGDKIEEVSGISTEDFAEARSYLRQEIDAFARSATATFIPPRVGGTVLSGVTFYAGTRSEPTPPPAEYYAALARYRKTAAEWGVSTWTRNDLELAQLSASEGLGLAFWRAQSAIADLKPLLGASVYPAFRATLSSFLAQDARRGVLRLVQSAGGTTFHFYGQSLSHKLRLVKGLDGLLCFTTGMVEGVPCTNPDGYTVNGASGEFGSETSTVHHGYVRRISTPLLSTSVLPQSDEPIFLVALRDPATTATPGNYEVLTGFVHQNMPALSTLTSFEYAILPEFEREAGELLRPNSKWCSRPAVECDGRRFDERMPLENELAEDGDGVESSWKHYLTLAEQAAAEAHALGEQYLQNGLEADRQQEAEQLRTAQDEHANLSRAEGELEALQEICGTAMNTEDLLGLVGADLSALGFKDSACTNVTQCCGASDCVAATCTSGTCAPKVCSKDSECCPSGGSCTYECVSQRCMNTAFSVMSGPTQQENLSRLKECIGEKKLLPYVVLGNQPVCVWHQTGNPSRTCYKSGPDFPCPVAPRLTAGGALTCVGTSHPTDTDDAVLVDWASNTSPKINQKLGLVDGGVPPIFDPCVGLRQLRHRLGDRDAICESIRTMDPPLFDDTHGTQLADTIRGGVYFDATYGPRVEIVQNDNVRWSTGPGVTPSTVWPCAAHPQATPDECDFDTPDALFCQILSCNADSSNTEEMRKLGRLNQRVLNAMVLLKALSSDKYEDIVFPVQMSASVLASPDRDVRAPFLDAPLGQAFYSKEKSTYIRQRFSPADTWGDPQDVTAIVDNPSSSSNTLFWRHYPATPSNATAVPINVSTNGSTVELLRSLRAPFVYPMLMELGYDASVCGSGSVGDSFLSRSGHRLPKGVSDAVPVLTGIEPDLPFLTTRFDFGAQHVADAAELLCEAARGVQMPTEPVGVCPTFDPTTLQTASDFFYVKAYADCRIRDFERALGGFVLPRIPVRVVQKLHEVSGTGLFPTVGGKVGEAMLRVRAALIRFGEVGTGLRDAGAELGDTIDKMKNAMDRVQVRTEQERIDIQNANLRGIQTQIKMDQIDAQRQAAWAMAAVDCNTGFISGLASAYQTSGASMIGAFSSCERTLRSAEMQVESLRYERQIAEVEATIAQNSENREALDVDYLQLEAARELIEHRAAVRSVGGRLSNLMADARASLEEIQAGLTELESLRLRALRSMERALQYQSTQAAVTENIDAVLHAKLKVTKKRYHRAHKNAIRLTFLAKRAIEQRLGIHLSELRHDLPLVNAPSTWESELCAAEGIDYEAIREAGGSSGANFAEAYIGDYVTRLKNVVESYRLQFDFQEGTDEAVASLRDDILKVRAPCPQFLGNLLNYSGTLDQLVPDSSSGGWEVTGCPLVGGAMSSSCLDVERTTDIPVAGGAITGSASGYTLTRGPGSSTARLVQRRSLEAGRYRLSWYSKVTGNPAVNPQIDAKLRDAATGVDLTDPTRYTPALPNTVNVWKRHYKVYELPLDQEVMVSLSTTGVAVTGSVAAIMLERLSDLSIGDTAQFSGPPAFVATDASLERTVPACEDTDGSIFRNQAFEYRCTKLCKDGFSESCNQAERPERCYWETTIGFDQRDLESGRILAQAGFAKGNFNYRIETVGVNFVGTSVRDCEESETPSACHAAGFIPYSLKHLGPYFVRNHTGAEFEAKLFTGNIEQARGLGLERYLSNPVSSTDRELIEPYIRSEFQGRPLDGSFMLRIWDEPGVNFDAIADVQLYLKYRYWTRFN
jgi:hypothetical protein